MSLRIRLTIWYGLLTGLAALVLAAITYGAHVRAHYEEIDQHLVEIAQTYIARAGTPQAPLEPPTDPSVTVRVYNQDGTVVAETPTADLTPPVAPLEVLADPAGAPYDIVARLIPISTISVETRAGEFGLAETEDGARWRTYVAPAPEENRFVVTAASLADLDEGIDQFRLLILGLLAVGGVVTLSGGWVLAGSALRPVDAVTRTANDLAESRAFDRRVPVEREDELGRLAATFNRMLDNLEEAYQLQHRFVGDASHELRAPLTAIRANLELLDRQPDLPDEDRREAIAEANQEARRLNRMVNDLLALARADAGSNLTLRPVEVDRIVLDVLNQVQSLVNGQHLRIAMIEPAMALGDSDQLRQLLIILLDNALKYTPAGGEVAVYVKRQDDRVELKIRDSGVGIPEADLPHIFERFYRADPARSRDPGGTGLGLSIAKWIVDQHRGSISVDSIPGQGTTIEVTFQAAH